MLQTYNEWKHRPPLTFEEIDDEIQQETVINEDNTPVYITTDTTDESVYNEDDTAAVAQVMMDMGQVVDI